MNAFALSGLLTGIASTAMAGWVYVSNSGNRLNKCFAVYALAVAGWGFGGAAIATTSDPSRALFLWRLTHVAVIFIPILLYHFVTIFINLRRPRSLLLAYVLGFCFLASDFTPLLIPRVHWVFGQFYYDSPGFLYPFLVVSFISFVFLSHLDLWRFFRHTANRLQRLQVQGFFLCAAIGFSGGVTCFLPVFGIDVYPYGNFAVPVYTVVMSYTILRYQLLDIRIAVSKGLVYSTLIAAITAIYLVMVLILERWFQGFIGYRSVVATLVVAFLIALGFNPLRGVVQAFVDRMLFQGTPLELVAQRERLLTQVTQGEQMKAVATLAAGLAHEIKNPLAAMKTFVEYLPEKHQDPEFVSRFTRVVGQEVNKMNDLVQRLLEFAKPADPVLREVDPHTLIKETLEFLQESFVRKQIKVTLSDCAGASLKVDPVQLRQVLLNVLLNSIEAMEGPGNIWISVSDAKGKRVISIKDDGPGISKENLARIFDPFFTTKATGTGLGLPVAQSIIHEHGGEMRLSSVQGKGTLVELSIPLGKSLPSRSS